MLRRVALVRTDVSDELSASIISVTRIGEIGTTLALRSVRRLVVMANVCRSVYHISQTTPLGIEPGPPGRETGD
jgi:hypothetical protein